MNPVKDIICKLLETPFARWKDEDKRNVLIHGRPTTVLSVSARKELKKSGKSYNVNCKSTWFTNFKWLCSSAVLQKLYCWPCLLFSKRHTVWTRDGFTDLLNITRGLHKHGDSIEHLKCEIRLRNFERNQNTVTDALKEDARLYKLQHNETVRQNRLLFHIVIDVVLYLSKHELLLSENFKELLELLIQKSSLELKNQYEKIKNIFTDGFEAIQNDLIYCISNYLNSHVEKELNDVMFFAIEVDETTDITEASQCSLIIRLVNSKGSVVERFLGFHNVGVDRTAETLYNMLDAILDKFNYKKKLVGQCYDGSSVMPEYLNGLRKKLKENAPQALFVHCLAHQHLALQQSLNKILQCRIFFANFSRIESFFTSTFARRIPTIADMQWSSNSELLQVIVEDWDKFKKVFDFVMSSPESCQNPFYDSKCLLNDMNNFEFTFLALVFNDILGTTDVLFDIIKRKSLDIDFCISQIDKIHDVLTQKRTDEFFEGLFNRAGTITEITSERETTKAKYRSLFYEILDHVLMEMDVRFQDYGKLKFVCLADTTKFERYHSCFPSETFENLLKFYGKIFPKKERLKNELFLLYSDQSYRDISLRALLNKLQEHKDIFMEAYNLFCLILTIPSTNVSEESSFFCLKRIKSYAARNTISQEILSSLANISIQREYLSELMGKQPFYEDIIDNFAALKERRIDLIYVN